MASDTIKAEMTKLKRLVNFKNSDDATLEKAAQKIVVLRELLDSGNFIDDKEQKLAKKTFENYLSKLDFENFSDLSTLSMLVYNEVLAGRLQRTINDSSTKDGKSYVSDKLIKSLSDLTNQILSLKLKLGVDSDKKEDEFTALQLLKKRFNAWLQENKNEATIYVPFECQGCGKQDVKPVLLRKRTKDFEVLEHPHLAGRFWFNKVAIEMVKSGKLSKSEYAAIFSTSVDFVQWCLDNEGRILPNTKNG